MNTTDPGKSHGDAGAEIAFPSDVESTAADWLARRDAGFLPGEDEAFRQWISADPRHAAAVGDLEAAWSVLLSPALQRETDWVQAELEARARRRAVRRRRLTWGSVAGLAAAAALVFAVLPGEWPRLGSEPATVTIALHPDRQVLADGSVVELNGGAEIEVNYSPAHREVRLVRGTAHFSVAKDANRPFVVMAGAVDVRAVGTEFQVSFASEVVDVLVTEGRVAIVRSPSVSAASTPDPLYVDAGCRVVVPADVPARASLPIETVTPVEMKTALSWRSFRIEFNGTPLGEAVELFNRSNRLQLVVADAAMGSKQINGVFWTDDPEGFARLLESSLSLHAQRDGEDRLVLRR